MAAGRDRRGRTLTLCAAAAFVAVLAFLIVRLVGQPLDLSFSEGVSGKRQARDLAAKVGTILKTGAFAAPPGATRTMKIQCGSVDFTYVSPPGASPVATEVDARLRREGWKAGAPAPNGWVFYGKHIGRLPGMAIATSRAADGSRVVLSVGVFDLSPNPDCRAFRQAITPKL